MVMHGEVRNAENGSRDRQSPATLGLRSVHLVTPGGHHASRPNQALRVAAVEGGPATPGPARSEALQEGAPIESLADAVDPTPAQGDIDRFGGCHGRLARRLLEDL